MPFTNKDARQVVNWFRGRFGLRDWNLALTISDEPPDWAADAAPDEVAASAAALRGRVSPLWVSPVRCEKVGVSPEAALIHEMLHVLMTDAGVRGDGGPRAETVWDMLDAALVVLYRVEVKGKR